MVPPPRDTYYCIPPPPLPEFYDSSSRHPPPLIPSETTVTSRPVAMAASGTDDGWRYVDIKKATKTPASSPSAARDRDVPPLAVYHICRICLRPRSERYHRDHPIPANGVPPPPGICRRYRVAPAEDLKATAEVTEKRESNTIRVGVGCLVSDEDAFTNSEMRDKRARRAASEAIYAELEPARRRSSTIYRSACSTKRAPSPPPREREEIIYRHIHEMIPPPPLRSPVRPAPASTAQDAIDAAEAARARQQAIVDAASHNATAGSTPWTRSIRIPPPPPSNAREASPRQDIADCQQERQASPRHSVSSRRLPPGFTEAVQTRRSSVTRSATSSSKPQPRERSEAEIRRLARDEVERYRHSERKLERHPSPYAHGRVVEVKRVPVERRIELEKDVPAQMPWSRPELGRKDSRLEPEREIEVVIERSRKQDKPPMRRAPSPVSSASSDKTRWPTAAYEATKSPRQDQARSDPERFKMVVEQKKQVSAELETNLPEDQSKELFKTFHEKALKVDKDGRPLGDAERKECVASRAEPEPSDRVKELQEEASRQRCIKALREHQSRHRNAASLPYPEDERDIAATMPSPTSHVSRSTRTSKPAAHRKDDGEYEYVVRKAHSYSRSPTRGRYDERETTERYLHRTRPGEETLPPEAAANNERGRRPSDASSRVHFSKKVEISPTPPGSNASSREFRDFARRKEGTRERGEDLIAEYERRGRLRNRDSSLEDERDRTPRPGQGQRARVYRRSDSEETADVDIPPWMRMRAPNSESPSRELPHELSRRSHIDDDLRVWDGSTNSEDSEEYVQKADYRQWRAK